MIKVEPKVQPAKVNTHGARLKDFDDTRVREEYIKQSQMSHFEFDPHNKLNHTMQYETGKNFMQQTSPNFQRTAKSAMSNEKSKSRSRSVRISEKQMEGGEKTIRPSEGEEEKSEFREEKDEFSNKELFELEGTKTPSIFLTKE